MEYDALDLEVTAVSEQRYRICVETPGWGEASTEVDFDPDDLAADLAAIDGDTYDRRRLADFGGRLYEILFPPAIAAAFMVSLGASRARDRGLRLQLRIEPEELRSLPWEFLHLPFGDRFIDRFVGTDLRTPLVRRLDIFEEIVPLTATPPVRVLVVAPGGSGLSDTDEAKNLTAACADLDDIIRVEPLTGKVTQEALEDALTESTFQVLHFIGHGHYADGHGYLTLQDDNGDPLGIVDEDLAAIVANCSIRLAVLSACEGAAVSAHSLAGVAPYLVKAKVPAVVAHQFPILDTRAVVFSRAFYRALANASTAGLVEAAVTAARSSLQASFADSRAVGAPVLYMRCAGRLFDVPVPTLEEMADLEMRVEAARAVIGSLEAVATSRGLTPGKQKDLEESRTSLAELEAALERGKRRRDQLAPAGAG